VDLADAETKVSNGATHKNSRVADGDSLNSTEAEHGDTNRYCETTATDTAVES
jgi:hypothetical protein